MDRLVLSWLKRDDDGLPGDFPETGYGWNQLGPLAQKFYADYHRLAWTDLLSTLTHAKDDLLRGTAARIDQERHGALWYGTYAKGRMIRFNSAAPYVNAPMAETGTPGHLPTGRWILGLAAGLGAARHGVAAGTTPTRRGAFACRFPACGF